MHHLRPTAIAGLLLVLVPAAGALSSCGFDYPTDRVNTIAGGVNNRDGDVDALGIRVLASATGEGRLIGALANNLREVASLDAVTSPDQRFEPAEFEPIEVPGRGRVNLSTDSNIPLTGEFTAGDFIKIELGFSNGEVLDLEVPVVKNCYQYTLVPTPSAAATGKASEQASEKAGEETSEAAGEGGEGGDARFNCSNQAPTPEGGEGGEE